MNKRARFPHLFSTASRRWMLLFHLPLLCLGLAAVYVYWWHAGTLARRLDGVQRTVAFAGRMSVHAQEMQTALLLTERALGTGVPVGDSLYRLQIASDRFNTIINSFNEGGEVVEPDLGRLMLDAIESGPAFDTLQQLNIAWVELKNRSDLVIRRESQKRLDAAIARAAIEYSLAQQENLAKFATEFANRLETAQQEAIARASFRRNAGLTTATLAFLLVPAVFLFNRARWARDIARATAAELETKRLALEENQRVLEEHQTALAAAQHESALIMDTVQEGLLLIDPAGSIGPQYSRESTAILHQPDLAGLNLLSLLQPLVTEKMHATLLDYLALLFDANRKERTVLKVNPLADIEVNFPNPAGGFTTRFLGFAFRRIMEGDRVGRVFVAMRDITAQVELECRLREEEKKKERQFEMLLGIVHVEPEQLDLFVKLVGSELESINGALRAEEFAATESLEARTRLRERLNQVFRSVHNIKGNAVYLKLDYFQKTAEEFESRLSELQGRSSLGGDDFLSIVVSQARLRADLLDLQELRGKLSGLRTAPRPGAAAGTDNLLEQLAAQVAELAAKLGKQVEADFDPLALAALPPERRPLARDILIQLVRNSLAHGIENAETRRAAGKRPVARLTLRCHPAGVDGLAGFVFRDDGAGLDLARIRRRAEAESLIAAEAKLPDGELAALIFAPGFSTAAANDGNAGRGMGMDIIKHHVVDEAGGEIAVRSQPGVFCEFACLFPHETPVAKS
ncbi:MAG TPA: ATP-binding protein [Opitutaceae bacterium]|nr:ATP-binding protein [Opitutaceae bacterium]